METFAPGPFSLRWPSVLVQISILSDVESPIFMLTLQSRSKLVELSFNVGFCFVQERDARVSRAAKGLPDSPKPEVSLFDLPGAAAGEPICFKGAPSALVGGTDPG